MAVIDILMNRLRRLFDRLRYPGKSVQYELRRMTPKGGWTNFYADPNYDHATAFPTPPPQPSFGSDTGYPPGKYQCVRRVDGRIESTMWTVESPTVDEYYATRREDATAETDEPTLEEALESFHNGSKEPFSNWLEREVADARTQSDDPE